MATIKKAISQCVDHFERDLDRAIELYERLVVNGAVRDGAKHKALKQPDRRDAAQFIFFEAAAKYESFVCDLFRYEVRKKLGISRCRADYFMGHADSGLEKMSGWAAPTVVRDRATNLFGKNGFFARLHLHLGQPDFQRLQLAHTLRNRVAHDGGKAVTKYRTALNQLNIPKAARQGAGVGRVLMDYPVTSALTDRWFHRFLSAYRRVGDLAKVHI